MSLSDLPQIEGGQETRAAPLLGLGSSSADLVAAGEPDDTRNLEETARFFDKSVPTVRGWIADGCPVVGRGSSGVAYRLSLSAVADWRDGLQRKADQEAADRAAHEAQMRLDLLGGMAIGDAAAGALTGKARIDAINAEFQATRLAQLRRELVSAEGVALALAQAFQQIAARVRSIPDALQVRLGLGEADHAAAGELVDDVLADIGDTLEALKPQEVAADAA